MKVIKPLVFALALVPAVKLAFDALTGGLGADPIEETTHRTGAWTLYILITSLAVTPLRRVTGWNQLIKLRRTIGLFALFYATLHFLTYLVLDLFFYLPEVLEDVFLRPYITVGFTAFVILIVLGATSNARMIKKLGGKRWNSLHRLVYLAGALGVFHFLWLVKADTRRPEILGVTLAALLGTRLFKGRARPVTKFST